MRVRLAYLYHDGETADAVLVDEGQDFDALYREFNRIDQAYLNGTGEYIGFTDFMESKGVKVIEFQEDHVPEAGDKE